MPIKLKPLIKNQTPQRVKKCEKGAVEIFREFVAEASSSQYKDDPYWELLRKKITPQKYPDVDAMFKRWRVLAGINK